VVFVDGSEQCNVSAWVRPAEVDYHLDCAGTIFDGLGGNPAGNTVTEIRVLEFVTSDGGTIWQISNATASNDMVCWESIPSDMMSIDVPVIEDVTTGPAWAASVFPDVWDLAVEADGTQAYLKFAVPEIQGKVVSARLFMHARPDMSADGDGGEVHVVVDDGWSEATMTWNTRPTPEAASLGRIGPAALDTLVSIDLGATAVTEAGTYSFAVVSRPTDTNGTQFHSKEGSPPDAAYLRISYEVHDTDGDGTPDGPDCDDADPAVGPGETEQCNGIDDDCDDDVDEGCPGAESGSASGDDSGSGGLDSAGSGLDGGVYPRGGDAGCACAAQERARAAWWAFVMLALCVRRRR